MRITLLIIVLASACKKSPPAAATEGVASGSPAAMPADAGPGRLAPSSLPFCTGDPTTDPLAALCRIDQPIAKAHFECAKPTPLMWCEKFGTATWSCRYDVPGGEALPAVTFRVTAEWTGAPVKSGEVLDPSTYVFDGMTRGVSIHLEEKDAARGKARVDELVKRFADVGCVVSPPTFRTEIDCGDWDVRVKYSDITADIVVDAARTSTRCM